MRVTTAEHKLFFRRLRLVLLFLLLLSLILLAPSASLLPGAFAETETLVAPAPLPIDDSAGYPPSPDGYLANGAGYKDASLSVEVAMTRAYDTDIMLVTIRVADPSQIRTAMASRYGSNSTAFGATIAKRKNAVLAINGDFFAIHSGGFLVRQGKVYRNLPDGKTDVLIIDDQGDFHIYPKATQEALAMFTGVPVNTFCFGPALIIDGVRCTELEKNEAAPEKLAQRICIAQTGPLTYLCVASEGPENKGSKGLTLEQFADFMNEQGCICAYNLDGGSSSTVILNNQKINALSTGKIRQLSDILYFASAVPAQ
ncbi:MAG: phosphodiester glycosidase family protein [Clostridiales bacterium]|nr:phosphodiester glycosidase family protein [Clostridiales bacterium]